jgi:cytochrome P450
VNAESSEPIGRVPADFMQEPYELLAQLREQAAVHRVVFPHGAEVTLVTRYDEVRELSNDPRVSKDGARINEMLTVHAGLPYDPEDDERGAVGYDSDLAQHLLNSDAPRHTRLRGLVSKAFTPQRVERLRPRVEETTTRLLDRFEGRSEVDFVTEFAQRLPLTTICELFGMPAEDHESFRVMGAKLTGAGQDPDEVADAAKRFVEYANARIDVAREHGGDHMLADLVQVTDDAGDRLTQGELRSMFFALGVAGHITTIHALGNCVANLLLNPRELATLKADLSLMPAAVEELLRYDGPSAVGTFRFTKAEIPVGDQVIPAGQILALSWHAANRDSSHFPDGDRLDLDRHPVGSLAFGHGVHYCIGVPLAKMQMEIALTQLLTRFPDLQLVVGPEELRWEHGSLLRGLLALPIRPA